MSSRITLKPLSSTFIDSWMNDKNFSEAKHYFLGLFDGLIKYRILFKFDLTDIPEDCQIVNAFLKIYCSRNDCMTQEKHYDVHLVLQDWSAPTVTWLSQPEFDSLDKVQMIVGSNISQFITWDITSLIRKLHQNPNLYKGIIIKGEKENELGSLLGFLSQRQENQDFHPQLDLSLSVPDNKQIYGKSNSKVAILTPQFFEWDGKQCLFGGGERYLIDYVTLLQKLGFEVDVFQPSTFAWEKTYNDIRIVGIENDVIDFDFLTQANKEFFNRTANYAFHVYFNLNVIYPYVFRNSICINHGIWWDSTERSWWRTNEWYQRLFTGLKNVNTLVSVDTNTINWLNAVVPDTPIKKIYIPNYVDLNIVGAAFNQEPGDTINILIPRRLNSQRGLSITKNVAVDLLNEYANLRFLFVGRGTEEIEQSMHAFAASHPGIEYCWYDMQQMYSVYKNADIVLIPSLSSEGTSLSLIEAMAFAKPVIAGLVGGLTDVVFPGYNGLLINVNYEELKKAILLLVHNPELRLEMGKNARSVAERFSKTIWEERWKSVIKECGWM